MCIRDSFVRKTRKKEETLLFVCNFAPVVHEKFQVGVPFAGKYKEILNSDSVEFGGSGVTNPRVKTSKKEEWNERPNSIVINVAPMSVSVFTCTPEAPKKSVRKTAGKKAAPHAVKAEKMEVAKTGPTALAEKTDPAKTTGTALKEKEDPKKTTGTALKEKEDPKKKAGTALAEKTDPAKTTGTALKEKEDPKKKAGTALKEKEDPKKKTGTALAETSAAVKKAASAAAATVKAAGRKVSHGKKEQ